MKPVGIMEAISSPIAPLDRELENKYHALLTCLSGLGSAITAFSGGVDSSLVAFLSHNVLGKRALAVTPFRRA